MSTAAAALALCIWAAGDDLAAHAVPASTFELRWTHSVEKVEWREVWRVTGEGLAPVAARVRGSGAGMEPPADARLVDGWYVYVPDLPTVPEMVLPDSGYSDPAVLCVGDDCRPLRDWAGQSTPAADAAPPPVHLAACEGRRPGG